MIFVTVGLHDQPFDRLVVVAGELAAQIAEPLVIQRGASRRVPRSCEYFDYTDEARMEEWFARARVVVAHGGAGTILEVLQAGRPLVLVPRLQRSGEVHDDHQLELVEALAARGRAEAVIDLTADALLAAVEAATAHAPAVQGASSLQRAVRNWLAGLTTAQTAAC